MRNFGILLVAILSLLLSLAAGNDTWDRAEIVLESDDQITDQVSIRMSLVDSQETDIGQYTQMP